jgi:hypothetical protein
MAETHGGRRPGAGRKPRAERFARPIAAAEKKIADRLPELVDNQFLLALGGGERIEERYETAGTVLIDGVLLNDQGKPLTTERGAVVRTQVPAFPDLDPTDLVLVERKVITLAPDRAANEYLVDRILGKPTQAIEAEISGPDGQPIPLAVEGAIAKIYGDPPPEAEGGSGQ